MTDQELIARLRVQKIANEMEPHEFEGADFEYGHTRCVLDGRIAADRIEELVKERYRLSSRLVEAEKLRDELAVCGSQASKLYSEVQITRKKLEAVAEVSETFRKAGQYEVSDAIRSALRYDVYAKLAELEGKK